MCIKNRICLSFLLLGISLLVGCSSSSSSGKGATPGRSDELQELATILPLYCGEHRKGPSKPADLAKYETAAPLGYHALTTGEILLVPGAMMAGEGDVASAAESVVAYEKKVPTEGGAVLLSNGKVKQMTAEEFKAASKAGK